LNPFKLSGLQNVPEEPAIFVANHQSALDIPVVGALSRGAPHVWLVLAYYLNTPVLGFFIRRMFIPVERDQPTKAAESLRKMIRILQHQPQHLIIFPEGARHMDGLIHEFYEGFALIAKTTRRPVIPVYMPNNSCIYPVYSFYVYACPLDVMVGEPMYIQEGETEAAFSQRVHAWFETQYTRYHARK
jgi:1-acyl-sn-glycerol-3-phosphate acyltransferase